MDALPPCAPNWQDTVSLAADATTDRVALSGNYFNQIEVSNEGNYTVFITFGTSAVTAAVPNGATGGGYPILAGQSKAVTVAPGVTHAAGICASGETTDVFFTPGKGM